MKWKTGRNVWTLVTAMFNDAVRSPRRKGLVIRADNPTANVAGPELRALRWDAVDFEHGAIHIRQATKRRAGAGNKRTKGRQNRRVPIAPALMPLFKALQEEAGESALVVAVPRSKNAELLRVDLKEAGVLRRELFAAPKDDPNVVATWAQLTFHDLRGTGVTWYALQGVDPLVISSARGTPTSRPRSATSARRRRSARTPPSPSQSCPKT